MPRKSVEEQIAEAEAKEAAIRERKRTLQRKKAAQDRKDDTRRKVIVGAIVLEHMKRDDGFREKIEHLLAKGVTREIDRKLLGLSEPVSPKPSHLTCGDARALGASGDHIS